VSPLWPGRICSAHFVRGGQHVRLPLTVQQARPFWQQRFSPQQRLVDRLQHFEPHSSSFAWQRLQRPVRSFAQRHPLGQHLFRPHHACPGGQRR
jgi:hypothetical protein